MTRSTERTTAVRLPGAPGPREPWPFDVVEPATGAVLAGYVGGGPADARAATDVAADALPGWAATPPPRRAAALRAIAAALREPGTAEDLAVRTARETGKRLPEARAEVGMSAGFCDWFATAVEHRAGRSLGAVPGVRHEIDDHPLGVVVVTTPWNFPLSIPARKIAAAVAAGCTVLFRPSEVAPGPALALAAIAEQHLPDGVLGTVLGDGAALTAAWLDDPRVRGISFTGSTRVGLAVAERARPSLTRCVLELGGNAPVVVLDDADPGAAAELAGGAKYRNNGQSCIAADSVWVPRRMLDDVVAGLVAGADALVLGDPLDERTTLGPLALPGDPARIDAIAEDARQHGARIHRAGTVPAAGHFARPVLAIDPDSSARAVTEESFGPVLAVLPYDDPAEVVRAVAADPLGLAAYVATSDPDRGRRVAAALDVGIVGVNTPTPNTPHVPFGGRRCSGVGYEGGAEGLAEFLEPRTVAFGPTPATASPRG